MKIVVFGGAGSLGSALTRELRAHGHEVITAGRSGCDVHIDFRFAHQAEEFALLVRDADVVVNAVAILMERHHAQSPERFDDVHVTAARALFEACAQAHVARVVQISALGSGNLAPTGGRWMASKRAAEAALIEAMHNSSGDAVIVRPSLLMNSASPSTRLLTAMAGLPIIPLPGLLRSGQTLLAPMQCEDAAQAMVRICEHPKSLRRVIELAGPEELTYRELLSQLRAAQGLEKGVGLGKPLWLPLPWWLMRWTAKIAEYFPQKMLSADGIRALQAGLTTERNEALYWLRHMPKPAVAQAETAARATHVIAH